MRVLTLKQLRQASACKEQVMLFEQMFGDSVEVTEELCVSVAQEFDWEWADRIY